MFSKLPSKELKEKMRKLILGKLKNNECMLTNTKTGEQYFIKNYSTDINSSDWHLYLGCDLVVGDVSLNYIISTLLTDCM